MFPVKHLNREDGRVGKEVDMRDKSPSLYFTGPQAL